MMKSPAYFRYGFGIYHSILKQFFNSYELVSAVHVIIGISAFNTERYTARDVVNICSAAYGYTASFFALTAFIYREQLLHKIAVLVGDMWLITQIAVEFAACI